MGLKKLFWIIPIVSLFLFNVEYAQAQTNLVGGFDTWSYSTACTISSETHCVDGATAATSAANIVTTSDGVHIISVDFTSTQSCNVTLNVLNGNVSGSVYETEPLELYSGSGTRSLYTTLISNQGYGIELVFDSTCNAEIYNPAVTYCGTDCLPVVPEGNSCPSGSTGQTGVLDNRYPDTLIGCTSVGLSQFGPGVMTNVYSGFPCDNRIQIPNSIDVLSTGLINTEALDKDFAIYFAIDPEEYMGNDLRVRFRFSFIDHANFIAPPSPLQGTWYLTYYSDDLTTSYEVSGSLDGLYREGYYHNLKYKNMYLMDEVIGFNSPQSGGFVLFTVLKTSTGDPVDYGFAVFEPHIRSSFYSFPAMCPFDGIAYSNTPTPEPTTTGTPEPPVSYNTPIPTNTATPIPFVTLPPRVQPTRLTIDPVNTIAWPVLEWPTVQTITNTITTTVTTTPTPIPTVTPAPTVNGLATAEAIATEWYKPVAEAQSRIEISTTIGVSNTTESIQTVMAGIAWPIRFAKSVRLYLPALWPYFAFAFSVFGLILFTVVWRFLFDLIGTIISILRKLWEAIPFN